MYMGDLAALNHHIGSQPRLLPVQAVQTAAVPVAALQSEGGFEHVSEEDRRRRLEMANEIRALPADALPHIRHFQTQVGCLNRCSFCSQSAGTTLWNLPKRDLANLISALKTVGLEQALDDGRVAGEPLNKDGVYSDTFVMPPHGLIGHARSDRPGVIYCYLDNDPAGYPHLDNMIQWLYQDLGVTVRIATVGFSRQNPAIYEMHKRISRFLMGGLAGLRLSFSPYTYGWTAAAERVGAANRSEFESDTAALLDVYRDAFLANRKGRKGACVELRFKPLVVPSEVRVERLKNRLVIRSGPYLILQMAESAELGIAQISVPTSHALELSLPPESCWLVHGRPRELDALDVPSLIDVLLEGRQLPASLSIRSAGLHRLENEDGEYFATDATRHQDGGFSKYFYPCTQKRHGGGYIDGERYLLNELLRAATAGQASTWGDIDELIARLTQLALRLEDTDDVAARYIQEHVITLADSYVRCLKLADYPARAFFDKQITVDTGHICNLGRAYHEYKAVASRADLPVTPNHERAFGVTGELAEEGVAWRLAVVPLGAGPQARSAIGKRNVSRTVPSILFEKLDLSQTATRQGQSRGQFFVRTDAVDKLSLRDTINFPVIPGHNGGA